MAESKSPFHPEPRLLQAGDGALTVEISDAIDPDVNDMVVAIDNHIAEATIDGVIETIPTYRSIQVVYDPMIVRSAPLVERLKQLIPDHFEAPSERRHWRFPVCYGGDHGMDLDFVAETHAITTDEVIDLHSGAEYRVYMIGFAPGFSYLGGLAEALHTPRRQNPRTVTPASSVSIGGVQAAISSVPVPSGWHMLGRTPARTFDRRRDQAFLLQTGDLVKFFPIKAGEFDRLDKLAEKGELIAECETTVT
ncbi:MAG: 5-oxoprolinase subunit PxpB [Rhodospirillales bacterium]|jgi:KipI family sensor histidine kinase inhibitor|nr:5-oxoprolinase subunit PxpB [Rhodospirillales bacterium]